MEVANGLCCIDELLPECKNHIFQFLSLQDCLRFTSASKRSLVAALPQLQQRRQQQFYQRYCYQLENPNLLERSKKWDPPAGAADDSTTTSDEDSLFCSRLVDKHHWHVIPSVGERINQLYRCIPTSHPSNNELRALIADLKDTSSSSSKSQTTTTATTATTATRNQFETTSLVDTRFLGGTFSLVFDANIGLCH